MKNRRIGKMFITAPLIDDMNFEEMLKMTNKFVVVRCEYLYHQKIFEYIAICPEFDEIECGNEPPIYSIETKTKLNEDTKKHEIIDMKFIRQV